jgi:predicted nucleic acid-binding protein
MPIVFLDAFGVIAFARAEPASSEVQDLLQKEDQVGLLSVNRGEIIDVLIRDGDVPTAVSQLLLLLEVGGLKQIGLDPITAELAGKLRPRHYRRRGGEVSLADCCVLAAAQLVGGAVASADPALADVARREGITVIPLPDSSGRRP